MIDPVPRASDPLILTSPPKTVFLSLTPDPFIEPDTKKYTSDPI